MKPKQHVNEIKLLKEQNADLNSNLIKLLKLNKNSKNKILKNYLNYKIS